MKTSELRNYYSSLSKDDKTTFRKAFVKETGLQIQTLYGYFRAGYALNRDRLIQSLVAEKISSIAASISPNYSFK